MHNVKQVNIVFIILVQSCSPMAPIRHYRPTFQPSSNNQSLQYFSGFLIFPPLSLPQIHTSTLDSHFSHFVLLFFWCRPASSWQTNGHPCFSPNFLSTQSTVTAELLVIGGVEVNLGLSSSLNLTFSLLNTRSVLKQGATAPLPNR